MPAPDAGVAGVRTLSGLTPASLAGTTVLVRSDLNVPLDDDGGVGDRTRIDASVPTLRHLVGAGAKVVVMSHLGRPKGEVRPELSLAPVARALSEALGRDVLLARESPGDPALRTRVAGLPEGAVLLLENLRFLPGETANDAGLVEALAALGDLYVQDAFGTAHRAHASTEGVPKQVRARGGAAVAGLLVERELRYLGEALADPERPFVAVMGGAKISGKIDVIEAILPRVDRLLVGGAMANTFFRALGLDTGKSLVEEDRVSMAADLMEEAGDRLILPVDCRVAEDLDSGRTPRVTGRDEVGAEDVIGDMGPESEALFASEIESAATVVWNGPMGVFESAPFADGTLAIARAMAARAERGGTSIVGGGDSAAAVEGAGLTGQMTHVSTGGGASLDLMAGRELPGIQALDPASADGGKAPSHASEVE
ncbi:MAG: phosphoglycerate kinase [Gemmatimonadales bacterium]|nr:MAG: phosphoglycerate kinase [Gemmatimonadales bacterium]